MYVYDEANKLAKSLSECEEYRKYKALKEKVFADEKTKSLITDYKKLQFEAQAAMLSGKEPDAETLDKAKKLGDILGFNPDVTEFLSAEYRLNTILSDIYRIIGESVDMGLDFLSE